MCVRKILWIYANEPFYGKGQYCSSIYICFWLYLENTCTCIICFLNSHLKKLPFVPSQNFLFQLKWLKIDKIEPF